MRFFCTIIAVLYLFRLTAQSTTTGKEYPPPHTIYAEIFGNGVFYTINYDRIIHAEKAHVYSFRVGFGYNSLNHAIFSVPVEFSSWWLISGNKYIETGIGPTLYNEEGGQCLWLLFSRIGLRVQPWETGLFFRLGLTPYIPLFPETELKDSRHFFRMYGGISIGYSFNNWKCFC
jgi:hypothetical protein